MSDADDVHDTRSLSLQMPIQRPQLRAFLNKHGISSRICLGIFSISDFLNEQTQTGLKACSEFYANPDIDKYEIRTIEKSKGHNSHYLVIGVWKNNNNKWWISPEGDNLKWPLTKTVIEKKSNRLKVRKMVSTISLQGILEVKYMNFGTGSILGNVEDGHNVRTTYKIIKNLEALKTLHGKIDV